MYDPNVVARCLVGTPYELLAAGALAKEQSPLSSEDEVEEKEQKEEREGKESELAPVSPVRQLLWRGGYLQKSITSRERARTCVRVRWIVF